MAGQAEAIRRVRDLLHEAPSIGVLTGAGVSAESGIPTFRDARTGCWSRFRPGKQRENQRNSSSTPSVAPEMLSTGSGNSSNTPAVSSNARRTAKISRRQ